MTEETPKPLTPIEDALKDVQPNHPDPNHALVVYQKHYKGRESELPFGEFLAAISKAEDETE
jgi:hypothetical protein